MLSLTEVKKASVSSFYKENNFKRCLTKQLLNMFKLRCKRGISQLYFSWDHYMEIKGQWLLF